MTLTHSQHFLQTTRCPLRCICLICVLLLILVQFKTGSHYSNHPPRRTRCAINFFGLPRAFKSLVLPSIIKNVIAHNTECDYFVHYYNVTDELEGRSGNGGSIHPEEILQLKEAIMNYSEFSSALETPIVQFTCDTEEEFWKQHSPLIEKIRTTKDPETGNYLYFPWQAKSYNNPGTTDNIIKMWHSIQSVWNLMERTSDKIHIDYDMVAMMRSDVVYVTPVRVLDSLDTVTIPAFGRYPVSDRMIVGPHDAVETWATKRFERLESHVKWVQQHSPGWGLHSERFMNWTIFPSIRDEFAVREHETLCFLRARADEIVRALDCTGKKAAPSIQAALGHDMKRVVEDAIGRKCPGGGRLLDCKRDDPAQARA